MNAPPYPEERVLPHALDAERSVLGAVLLHGDRFPDAAEHVEAKHFYRKGHQLIFRRMVELAEANVAIDYVTVKNALVRAGELDDVGGPAYITALSDGVPRSMNVAEYAQIVRSKARLRDVIVAANTLLSDAYEDDQDAREVVDRAEQTLFALAQGNDRAGFKQLRDILPGVMTQIERWHETKQGVTGLSSGFNDLDAMTCGFQPSELVILAARPSMGKSAMVLNIAQHAAQAQKSVGIFSLEMSELELAVRALTAQSSIDSHRLRRGYLRESEWSRLSAAFGDLEQVKLFIDESPFITVFEMRARARRLKAEQGLDLLIIDYTQLMIGTERRENRTLELGAISRSLKALAKDLKIPVIALSQLSRKVEERHDKHPILSDLRESGALEQDADLVLFIYREAVYQETDQNRHVAEVIIAKQRNGPIGTVRLGWIPEETRFVNLSTLAEPADQRLPMGDR